MLTLAEVKTWLRLEQEDTIEDALLQSLILAAEEYVRNAVPAGMAVDINPIARLLGMVLVADWHENREAIGSVREELRPTVRTLILQLQTAYPVIETTALPDATVGNAYLAVLEAGGGAKPYKWSIVEGALPAGLVLDPKTGQITGTPAEEGEFSFTVHIEDRSIPPRTAVRELSIKVVIAHD